ncbi:hypothetical protein EVJ58_g597 [Rhodofomes roseus]|uniref:Integrase core domain-containing protein n=1 Tax=Rhodofomes roseus TaxID=34475 RepID=A0A4Y9Z4Q1_9APHY|nr:hypothetical protein EVJ58_g597 [Rhodofomes roseus]
MELPPLPRTCVTGQLALNIEEAHKIIAAAYNDSLRVVALDDSDHLRLQHHIEHINNKILPLLEHVSQAVQLPEWTVECALKFAQLLSRLEKAANARAGRYAITFTPLCIKSLPVNLREELGYTISHPVLVVRTGRRGRPQKVINKAWLIETFAPYRRISVQRVANVLGVDRGTVLRYMKKYNIVRTYAPLTDEELDLLVRSYKVENPNAGRRIVQGFFTANSIRMSRARLTASLGRVDGVGQMLRRNVAVHQRSYSVPRPGHLWHIDGHHKLMPWSFVLHGIVDGYEAEDVRWLANITRGKYNEPTDTFAGVNPDSLAEHYGVQGPVHVRRSHQTGAGHPPDEENEDDLDTDNISDDAVTLSDDEDDPISLEAVWEEANGEAHAQESDSDSDSDFEGLEECFADEDAGVVLARRLADEHHANLRHEAIKVPRHTSPFASEQAESAFFQTLEEVYALNLIPSNMGVLEEEWADDGYPTEGQLKVGRVRIITIAMPHSVWLVRARRWCQALDLLVRLCG